MVAVTPIAESHDPRIARFRDLNHAERRRDRAGADGIVIGEGTLVIDRMVTSFCPPTEFLGTERGLERLEALPDYSVLPADLPFYLASEETIAGCVGFAFNRHIFALAPRPEERTVADVLATEPETIVIMEGLNDHANIGSVFRNAAALGVNGVLFGAGCADPLYRRAVRVSMGHALRIPFATCEGDQNCWQEPTFAQLRDAGYQVVALTPAADAQILADVCDETRDQKIAFIIGAEGPGLRRKTMRLADVRAQIPMFSGVDSLNVATSAAVAFYERARRS